MAVVPPGLFHPVAALRRDHLSRPVRRERPPMFVVAHGRRFMQGEVKAIDISEGPQGEDILTFKCPECGGTHDSRIFLA